MDGKEVKASKMEGGIICRSGARYVLTIKREGDWRAVLAGRKNVIIARVIKCWYLLEHVSMVGSSKQERILVTGTITLLNVKYTSSLTS